MGMVTSNNCYYKMWYGGKIGGPPLHILCEKKEALNSDPEKVALIQAICKEFRNRVLHDPYGKFLIEGGKALKQVCPRTRKEFQTLFLTSMQTGVYFWGVDRNSQINEKEYSKKSGIEETTHRILEEKSPEQQVVDQFVVNSWLDDTNYSDGGKCYELFSQLRLLKKKVYEAAPIKAALNKAAPSCKTEEEGLKKEREALDTRHIENIIYSLNSNIAHNKYEILFLINKHLCLEKGIPEKLEWALSKYQWVIWRQT